MSNINVISLTEKAYTDASDKTDFWVLYRLASDRIMRRMYVLLRPKPVTVEYVFYFQQLIYLFCFKSLF